MKKVVLIALGGVAAIGAAFLVPYGSSPSPTGPVELARRPLRPSARAAAHPRPHSKVTEVPVARASFMPETYRVLLTRSIFSLSGQTAAGAARPGTGNGIALRGIMQEGAGFIAFVEDTTARTAQQVKVGDSLGGGRVTRIDLHGIEFAFGGRTTRIEVGQTIGGTLVGMPALPAVAQDGLAAPRSEADLPARLATIR